MLTECPLIQCEALSCKTERLVLESFLSHPCLHIISLPMVSYWSAKRYQESVKEFASEDSRGSNGFSCSI